MKSTRGGGGRLGTTGDPGGPEDPRGLCSGRIVMDEPRRLIGFSTANSGGVVRSSPMPRRQRGRVVVPHTLGLGPTGG